MSLSELKQQEKLLNRITRKKATTVVLAVQTRPPDRDWKDT